MSAAPRDGPSHEISTVTDFEEAEENEELRRMPSAELAQKVEEFKKIQSQSQKVQQVKSESSARSLLVNELVGGDKKKKEKGHVHAKKGAFAGVFVPTCENMWGVLIFLRFYFIVGHAGVGQALLAVVLSFTCAFCTTSSMVATVSSGGMVSKGGPYYMISRALGPVVGATVGMMYWMAITMLAVLEVLGAVEGILMASKEAEFPYCQQAYGSGLLLTLVMMVWAGMDFISRIGILFVFVVFFTLFLYYYGLGSAPLTEAAMQNEWITGLSFDTLRANWYPHYGKDVNFGVVLSVFFPCFTGILSGANRADVLRDPPKNLRQGTFGAIIFSLFMYSSYMILWGMVADYRYLQGIDPAGSSSTSASSAGRRLAGGGGAGAKVVDEVVWNPFPHAAHVGIIISSLSQALQCLVVAPRLLQAIAKDEILVVLNRLAPLSRKGEPVRALFATYLVAGALVLLGKLDLVAPLLSMCFLVAYTFMNLSCCALTWLKSTSWRPKGIHQKRWRLWYLGTSGLGTVVCVSIMFTINPYWAMAAFFISMCLYFYVNWKQEQKGWGSAMDGIRFQLALNALIQLEASQHQVVNWRPQVLILYKVHLVEELRGIKHHEILRFYNMLRKSGGFCVVACVLEADKDDEHALHKARMEKGVIQSIMKEEQISGFAEVVVAPTWSEGTNYVIQLTGIGGLTPNTILLDWPLNYKKHPNRALDFVNILRNALASEKAVLAVKGLRNMPSNEDQVHGTIDVWWLIHDGGFLILLSWLLMHYRTWRKCHLRVFTITENVSAEQADKAAQLLTRTLRQRRLFDVDVEVILADDEMIEPFTFDSTERVQDRHTFLEANARPGMEAKEAIPMEIADLFQMQQSMQESGLEKRASTKDKPEDLADDRAHVKVSDMRRHSKALDKDAEAAANRAAAMRAELMLAEEAQPEKSPRDDPVPKEHTLKDSPRLGDIKLEEKPAGSSDDPAKPDGEGDEDFETEPVSPLTPGGGVKARPSSSSNDMGNAKTLGIEKLNSIIYSRSKRAQMVVMNLPDLRSDSREESLRFMSYCEGLTTGLERVLFVHSTGHEVFDIG
eukprot:TRINITY_DN5897_c0_g3_i1.p1 TRINITY_DN5897_c0_g3~~TRINITY_DN5897_c0_g3_i1.p1  ORF type:complete len:1102 (-),score=265.99 TRINITY_DN5897_c0_g3_i1:399-3605(-)